jgi:hypothetical protein
MGLCSVLSQPGYRWLQRIPVALAIDLEIGCLVGQATQTISEGGWGLPGLDTSELDRAVIYASVGRLLGA